MAVMWEMTEVVWKVAWKAAQMAGLMAGYLVVLMAVAKASWTVVRMAVKWVVRMAEWMVHGLVEMTVV